MLAYVHLHHSGFVPCRLVGRSTQTARATGDTWTVLHAKLTADRGPWRKGETIILRPRDFFARPLRVMRGSGGKLTAPSLAPEHIAALPELRPV
jgi:hypothetical protein